DMCTGGAATVHGGDSAGERVAGEPQQFTPDPEPLARVHDLPVGGAVRGPGALIVRGHPLPPQRHTKVLLRDLPGGLACPPVGGGGFGAGDAGGPLTPLIQVQHARDTLPQLVWGLTALVAVG